MASNAMNSLPPRTLILCFDGTDNEYDSQNTNVVKFFSLLKKDDFSKQLCYYQAGIGTFFSPGVVSPFFQWCAKVLDEAVAWYLDAHVMDGYKFLMNNYKVGDKICLFGFSRGAYSARALGGMLHKVGLLPRDNDEQVPFAYKMYKQNNNADLAAGFKQTYCQDVTVQFMGVWDTVSSVGVVMGRTLPFTSANSAVRVFRQALSLDEHRTKFRPNLYHRPSTNSLSIDVDVKQLPSVVKEKNGLFWRFFSKTEYDGDGVAGDPDVLEVWFSGCHSDVGGGSVTNSTAHSLANIPLRWMVGQAIESRCGILFNDGALVQLSLPLVSVPVPESPNSPSSEENLDQADALEPIHDELKINPLWWILEVLPIRFVYQDRQGVWKSTYRPNLGRGRRIIDAHPNFHVSVKQRLEDSALGYIPKAQWKAGSQVYVK